MTPMPQNTTRGNRETGTVSSTKYKMEDIVPEDKPKPTWKKLLVPILVVVGTLVAIIIVAVVIIVIRQRNKKNSENNKSRPAITPTHPPTFTPATLIDDPSSRLRHPPIAQQPTDNRPVALPYSDTSSISSEPEERSPPKQLTTKELMQQYQKINEKNMIKDKAVPSKADDNESGPPLEEPLPRISYNDISNKKKQNTNLDKKNKTAPKPRQRQREKTTKKEDEQVMVTASYLRSLLAKVKESGEENPDFEDPDSDIGVVNSEKNTSPDPKDEQEDGDDEEEEEDDEYPVESDHEKSVY